MRHCGLIMVISGWASTEGIRVVPDFRYGLQSPGCRRAIDSQNDVV
jgi:hypothetical protein